MADDRVVEQLDLDLLEISRLNDELASSHNQLPGLTSHSKFKLFVKKLGLKLIAPFFRIFMRGQIRINHLQGYFSALVLNNRRDIRQLERKIQELEKRLSER